MIKHAGFFHSSEEKQFSYEYLSGTHLLQTLTKSNNMSLTLSYEDKRDLLTGMAYKRGSTTVASRTYIYDAAGRPITRNTARNGTTVNDSFGYNTRSELTAATVNNGTYSYNYDNIGNRNTAQEITEEVTNYTANNLNQYTAIGDFAPTYDAAGNRTLVKTTTGIWTVAYDAENRPVSFNNAETNTVIECAYDHMGRRATKKVTVNGAVTLHHRYLYRGYLQIACCDLTRTNHPCLWLITWDPTQPIATRPLAIQKDGTWYTYGWDLTKNICELYGINGYIRTTYTYTPYGAVTISGDVTQPIQWSSEFHDDELALVYYNYRHYNPTDGRWTGKDFLISLSYFNPYMYVKNLSTSLWDLIGLDYAPQHIRIANVSIEWWDDDGGVRGKDGYTTIGVQDEYLATVYASYEATCDCGRIEKIRDNKSEPNTNASWWGSANTTMEIKEERLGRETLKVTFTSRITTSGYAPFISNTFERGGAIIGACCGASGGIAGITIGSICGQMISFVGDPIQRCVESLGGGSSYWSTSATFSCSKTEEHSKPDLKWGNIEPNNIWIRSTSARKFLNGYEHYVPLDKTNRSNN